MMFIMLVGALLISFVSSSESDAPCSQDATACKDFSYVFHRLLEPRLEEFLQANCRFTSMCGGTLSEKKPCSAFVMKDSQYSSLLENVKCHVDLREKCPLTEEKLDYLILAGYFSVFTVVCDENSALRKALFRNLECYKKNLDTQIYCEDERFKPVLSYVRYEKNTTNLREDAFLAPQYFCLYITLRRYCLVGKLDQACGREAAIAANEILYLLEKESCPAEMTVIWLDKFLTYLWSNFSKD